MGLRAFPTGGVSHANITVGDNLRPKSFAGDSVIKEAENKIREKTSNFPTGDVVPQTKSGALDALAKEGQAALQELTDEEKAKTGSKRDKVEFIACLFHPGKRQTSTGKPNEDGKKTKAGYMAVGYSFKALEDVEIPVYDYNDGIQHELDCSYKSKRQVKAGELFYLNHAELGAFITRLEYNGMFTGGDLPVVAETKVNRDRVDTQGNLMPMCVLRLAGRSPSIKAYYVMVARIETRPDGTRRYVTEEGFERWDAYTRKFNNLSRKRTSMRVSDVANDRLAGLRKFHERLQEQQERENNRRAGVN